MDLILNTKLNAKSSNKKLQYTIGVEFPNYCLARTIGGIFEIILEIKQEDKKQFKKDVKNLSRLFNAYILKEENTK